VSALHLGDYRTTLAGEMWDALICDPPYSARTHRGHDAVATSIDRRRDLGYSAYRHEDARGLVEWAAPRTRGWMVVMCDHVLAPHYEAAMSDAGRVVFAPLVWYAPGSRVRITGDGPACWVCWIVVSRPRSREWARWGSLPGGYAGPPDRTGEIGGKPLWLMRSLVRDYSRPGDVVCDPCAGLGTTLTAARAEGRRWIGSEVRPETHAIASGRLADLPSGDARQRSLFDE